MKVVELKVELRRRGESLSGNKSILKKRLEWAFQKKKQLLNRIRKDGQ
jgi:hypothetical protein